MFLANRPPRFFIPTNEKANDKNAKIKYIVFYAFKLAGRRAISAQHAKKFSNLLLNCSVQSAIVFIKFSRKLFYRCLPILHNVCSEFCSNYFSVFSRLAISAREKKRVEFHQKIEWWYFHSGEHNLIAFKSLPILVTFISCAMCHVQTTNGNRHTIHKQPYRTHSRAQRTKNTTKERNNFPEHMNNKQNYLLCSIQATAISISMWHSMC